MQTSEWHRCELQLVGQAGVFYELRHAEPNPLVASQVSTYKMTKNSPDRLPENVFFFVKHFVTREMTRMLGT